MADFIDSEASESDVSLETEFEKLALNVIKPIFKACTECTVFYYEKAIIVLH